MVRHAETHLAPDHNVPRRDHLGRDPDDRRQHLGATGERLHQLALLHAVLQHQHARERAAKPLEPVGGAGRLMRLHREEQPVDGVRQLL